VIVAARLPREQLLAVAEDDAVAVVMKGSSLADERIDLLRLPRQVGEGDLGERVRRRAGKAARREGRSEAK